MDGRRATSDDHQPQRITHNHGGATGDERRATTDRHRRTGDERRWTMHDARRRWTTHNDGGRRTTTTLDCASVDTQLCDYRPSCRIQNSYFKIKYTLLMECQSAADCRTDSRWSGADSPNRQLSDRQSTSRQIQAQIDCPTVRQSTQSRQSGRRQTPLLVPITLCSIRLSDF